MAFMLLAVSTLALMDGCLKALSGHYSALQVATIRSISAMPFVLGWVALTIGFRPLLKVRFPLHLLRGAIGIMMLTFFTWALRRLALVEAYSIFFIAPILITAFAALILHERVDARRWLAIGVGFATVLAMLRPTGEGALTLAGLAILLSAVGYALSAITVRVLHRTDSSQSMVFWVITIQGIGAAALSFANWQPILRSDWLVIGALAVTGSVGQWAITEAFRHAEASLIAPFEYTALIWGAALDWIVWRTTPTLSTLLGAAVLVVSGVYLLRREEVHVEAEHP
jgi:drug/metabolite transporter (DMT)-like permease